VPVELEAEGLVLVTQRVSVDRLFDEVSAALSQANEPGVRPLYRIGDCVTPRLLADAIFDGHRLGREIDAETPARQKSYLREEARLEAGSGPINWV
jgi:dimethylamine/trimethylamine dehydrogenase